MRLTRSAFFSACMSLLIFAGSLLAIEPSDTGPMYKQAPALPPPTGEVLNVSTVSELNSAIANLKDGQTIVLAAGEYKLTSLLVINGPDNVSIRGATGNRDDVIIRGKGMAEENYGMVPHCFEVGNSDDLLIADLTIADAWYHNIHLAGSAGPIRTHLYNLRLMDCGEQLLKVNPGYNPTAFPDSGLVEYCRFEFTDRAKHYYTNGVDVLDGADWIVRDCEFYRIRGPVGVLAGSAVLFWHYCIDPIVERCYFEECDFGITMGLGGGPGNSKRFPDSDLDNEGGIIRNNIVFRKEAGDIGISVNHAKDYVIANNTVILNNTFLWNIEYRFSNSTGIICGNLSDGSILKRNEAQGTLSDNITNPQAAWFVDPENGDFHLTDAAADAIDQVELLDLVEYDYDGHPREDPELGDVGADEYDSLPAATDRGDINGDGTLNIADAIQLILKGLADSSDPAADFNGDGIYTITDAISLILYIRGNG